METEQQVEQPPKRATRSDKGKRKSKGNPEGAMSSVMIAVKELSREEVKRVLTAVATFHNIRLIEAPIEGANGKRD